MRKVNNTIDKYVNIEEELLILVETVTKTALETRENNWWLDDALDIYSKEANIRQLRREKFIRSPKAFNDYCNLAKFQPDWCPWLPGLSFLTDGLQLKLPLVSLRNTRTPGYKNVWNQQF